MLLCIQIKHFGGGAKSVRLHVGLGGKGIPSPKSFFISKKL